MSAVAATLLLIAMGGVVRATDSGLACPDWPACYGRWIPPADLSMWLEHSHRLWAGVVMALVGALAVRTTARHRRYGWVWCLSVVAFGLVLVQAGLGAAVVLALLPPGLVATHLATSFLIVGCLIVVAVLARPTAAPRPVLRRPSGWAVGAALLVLTQAVLGSWATGHGIAYAFNAVPLWSADEAWTASARQLLHVAHRGSGYVVAVAVIALAFAVRGHASTHRPRWARALPDVAVGLVVVQVGLGLANVLTRGDELLAAAHLAVASWLWAAVVAVVAVVLAPAGTAPPPRRPGPLVPDRSPVGAERT